MRTSFEKDIDIVGGISTVEEGTISGLLTIYGEVEGNSMLVQAGYGFDTPRFTVGTVSVGENTESTWEHVCAQLESAPQYDENGNVTPRAL